MAEEIVKVIIPSHKRAGKVSTIKHISNAIICIPEAQYKDYLEYYDKDILICHPDSIIGLPPKRQWIYETFHDVFMVDDDSDGMHRLWPTIRMGSKGKTDPVDTYDIIQQTADTAKQLGAKLFSFGRHVRPITCDSLEPFRFGPELCGGEIGIFYDGKLFWPSFDIQKEDIWISLLNAFYNRYMFIDSRFAFGFKKTFVNPGGCTDTRMKESELCAIKWLKGQFGNVVVERIGVEKTSTLNRRNMNKERHRIVLPYHV